MTCGLCPLWSDGHEQKEDIPWAVENGVTNGIGDELFGPNNSCTRAQIVTFLFRAYQGK
ncbi:S-layer homology domain-containing protein [Dysosmobacter sp.]|uniref:S-layer homology domain-containing protein n=1 Tax=Dysosmobacter sp. TaxID=2591382 RepID=UPI003AB417F5